jgi:diphthamide biosynthesis protein 7
LLEPDQTGQLVITSAWVAHAHEPWCVAWNYYDPNVIYSGAARTTTSLLKLSDLLSQGGDDLQLKVWDKRQGFEQPIITNKRCVANNACLRIIVKQLFRFDAGVTCIQSHPNIEHLIAVGSYDATVRLFDSRKPLKPLSQADIGGGAWRVKWHPSPSRANDLLVAAMHDGFKIVRFTDIGDQSDLPAGANGENWEVIKRYDEHKSLAYGVDWSYKSSQGQPCGTLIASASFYDHALHLWRG